MMIQKLAKPKLYLAHKINFYFLTEFLRKMLRTILKRVPRSTQPRKLNSNQSFPVY